MSHSNSTQITTQYGFSLIEMAMVLLILSILLSGITLSLSQSVTNARRTETKNQLEMVQEALYGYAQDKGFLPCPADETGIEDCLLTHGFVPNGLLSLPGRLNGGLLLDPWQNPLRYSVIADFKFGGDITNVFKAPLPTMFTVCDDSTTPITDISCAANALTNSSPIIIFSIGENWNSYNSPAEQANSGNGVTLLGTYNIHPNGDNNFVSTGYSEDNFDDLILWLSPYTLYSRMIKAGQLP